MEGFPALNILCLKNVMFQLQGKSWRCLTCVAVELVLITASDIKRAGAQYASQLSYFRTVKEFHLMWNHGLLQYNKNI